MRKWIALVLALLMVFSLCACGNSEEKQSMIDSVSTHETTNGNASPSDAQSEVATASEGRVQEVEVSEELIIGEWIDVKTSQRVIFSGNGMFESWEASWSQPGNWSIEENMISVASSQIDDDLRIEVVDGTISLVNDDFNFMRWESLPKEKLSIGETSGGDITLTLDDVVMLDSLPADVAEYAAGYGNEEELVLGEGMCYAQLKFTVTNLSKQEICVGDQYRNLTATLNYNDGFRFSTNDENTCYFASNGDYVISGASGSMGAGLPIQPLETRSFEIILECSQMLATDNGSPVQAEFIIVNGTSANFYEFIVR